MILLFSQATGQFLDMCEKPQMYPRPFMRRLAVVLTMCLGANAGWGLRLGGDVLAMQEQAAAKRPIAAREGVRVEARSATVTGVAWNAANQAISDAKVRLRNVVTGRVVSTAVTDTAGQFAFARVAPGTYLVELLGESGKLLMVGQTFAVAAGEKVATFIRLAAKAPWFDGFFRNAASAVVATAAGAGVTAVAPDAKPCSSPSPGCT